MKSIQHSKNDNLYWGSNLGDISGFVILLILYFFQGIPMGMIFGSIPFILKGKVGYKELGIFSLASYPYSLKLLWSPIVDKFYIDRFGKRKSWIIPTQIIIILILFWLGNSIEDLLYNDINIWKLTLIYMLFAMVTATQDIATDGWALTILSKKNIKYGSLAQSIGLDVGYFCSFAILLALTSADFYKDYLKVFLFNEEMVLKSFFWTLGCFCLIFTFMLLFKSEQIEDSIKIKKSIFSTYKTILNIISIPNMPTFIIMLLVHKFGYLASEIATPLRLIDKGFRKEDLAIIVLINFPLQLALAIIVMKWISKNQSTLTPWIYANYFRNLLSILAMVVVYIYPENGNPPIYHTILIFALTIAISSAATIMFLSAGAFFTYISDPKVGGTYVTLLNTVSNLAGIWPRYFILQSLGFILSTDYCMFSNTNQSNALHVVEQDMIGQSNNNNCSYFFIDGYYLIVSISVIISMLTLKLFIQWNAIKLDKIPSHEWHLKCSK